MSKVAVIGDYDSIYGFAAIGLATFPVVSLKRRLNVSGRYPRTGMTLFL